MFDVTFTSAVLLKKIFNALNDVLKEVSFECSDKAIEVKGMDASHVSLVQLYIKADTEGPVFKSYRCDKASTLSFKVETIQKILKTLSNDEEVQMLVTPDSDVCLFKCYNKQLDRTSEYTVKLLELENEHLGVPDEAYPIEIQMPSGEFAKMMKDLSVHGESLSLDIDKTSMSLQVKGDDVNSKVTVKERDSKKARDLEEQIKKAEEDIEAETVEEVAEEEPKEDDVPMEDEGESLTEVKKDVAKKKPKKEKSEKEDEKEGEDENLSRIVFKVEEPCQTIYSLRYMNMFAKAAPLSNHVRLSVSSELPIIVKFPLEEEERGHLSFFLAPKIDE